MFTFLKKLRRKLLKEGKVKSYLLYAFGEIFLIVIGILLALQISNWNEDNKTEAVEIQLLEGIRNDLLQDTIDLNYNVSQYKEMFTRDSSMFHHLMNQEPLNDTFKNQFTNMLFSDLILTLHRSAYDEAKEKGLSIIENPKLRKRINRLYEFKYPNLLVAENEYGSFNLTPKLIAFVEQYINVEKSKKDHKRIEIGINNYEALLVDDHLRLALIRTQVIYKNLMNDEYFPILKEIDEITKTIELELDRLK